ncbi:MAG: hypothetical protein MI810_02820 [Flavobacteriales bacterium]|nr:hypothetical protein [Flavobacteriales bacterium]
MKNFRILELDRLKDTNNYQFIEEGIYNDLKDDGGFATHRIAMAMELEEGENSQYPLEDVLDKFYVHVEEFLESNEADSYHYILGGELDDIQSLKSIIGKRVYNKEFVDEEGQTRVQLIIE